MLLLSEYKYDCCRNARPPRHKTILKARGSGCVTQAGKYYVKFRGFLGARTCRASSSLSSRNALVAWLSVGVGVCVCLYCIYNTGVFLAMAPFLAGLAQPRNTDMIIHLYVLTRLCQHRAQHTEKQASLTPIRPDCEHNKHHARHVADSGYTYNMCACANASGTGCKWSFKAYNLRIWNLLFCYLFI